MKEPILVKGNIAEHVSTTIERVGETAANQGFPVIFAFNGWSALTDGTLASRGLKTQTVPIEGQLTPWPAVVINNDEDLATLRATLRASLVDLGGEFSNQR